MLARTYRFHGLGSLNFAYKKGQTVRGPLCSLKFVPNPRRATFRVAIVVSRKVSKSAVVRNRIRRRLYESFEIDAPSIAGPYDLLFSVFSDQAATVPFAELQRQSHSLLTKAGVLALTKQSPHGIVSTEGNK